MMNMVGIVYLETVHKQQLVTTVSHEEELYFFFINKELGNINTRDTHVRTAPNASCVYSLYYTHLQMLYLTTGNQGRIHRSRGFLMDRGM